MVVRSVSSWHHSDRYQSTPQRLSEFPPRFSFPLLTPTPPPPHSLHGQGYARREHDEKNYTKRKDVQQIFLMSRRKTTRISIWK